MSTIISISNQKGGVSKTTSTINLAYALTQRGKRVLAVDMDPQHSLTVYYGKDPLMLEEKRQTIYWGLTRDQNYKKDIASLIIPNSVDLLPSSLQLSKAEIEFIFERWDSSSILRDELKPVCDQYDIILIDCPPSLSLLTVNALVASDGVLIPVSTDFLSLMGVTLLLETIADVRSKPNPSLEIIGILPTKYNAHYTQDQDALDALTALAYPNIHMFKPINRSTWYDRAASEGISTLKFKPDIPGVQNYYQVADYIIDYGKET